jgi:hypothetical protein
MAKKLAPVHPGEVLGADRHRAAGPGDADSELRDLKGVRHGVRMR